MEHINQKKTFAFVQTVFVYLLICLSVMSLPGLILIYILIPKVQTFSQLLYNLTDNWLENLVSFHLFLYSGFHYLYIICVIFGNMALTSFFAAFLFEYFPTLCSSHIVSTSVVYNILHFFSFATFMCIYFMLLFICDYGVLLLVFFASVYR